MKKKGFTLIELLAAIVILAIIALIATPAVLNIIEDSRKGAAEASARNILNSAKTYYMQEKMNGRTLDSIDLSTNTLKYDGDQATKGTITFEDGKASGKMYVGGYCVEVAVDGKVTSEKKTEDECIVGEENGGSGVVTPEPDPTPEPEPEPTTYTKYNDGTPLLYDPVNNVKCEAATSSATGTNDTCMKWYAFLDSEESSTVNLLLDHNTTDYVAWNYDFEATTPDTVNAKLQADIKNWNAAVKSTARLISASEVNQIAPTIEGFTWTETDYTTGYNLHTGNKTEYTGAAGSNTYAWLFDNTYGCELYGCNTADYGTKGYWTSSYASFGYVWRINVVGNLDITIVGSVDYLGVRPVITVSKSVFK